MADLQKSEEKQQSKGEVKRVRLTFSSSDVKAVEKVCADFINNAKRNNIKTCGPKRMPVKNLKITTRKTPCGQGSKTWDKFEMRLYRRVIDICLYNESMQEINSFGTIDQNVTINVDMNYTRRKKVI